MRSLRLSYVLALALTLLLGLAATGLADESNGKLQAVLEDEKTFIMTDQDGQEFTFRLADDARLEINGEERALTDLQEGDQLTVTWEQAKDERIATIVNCVRD
jgi:hypothetical protein